MEKKTVVALGMGVVAVGGVLLYMKSQKDKSEADANLQMARVMAEAEAEAVIVAQQEAALPPPPPAYVPPLRRIEVRNGRGMGEYKWFGIESNSRSKASASLEIGDEGIINGTIPCTVSDFWIDANGKKGAFRCDGMDYYDIPNGSRFEW
tara:strand:+ start:2398 stop:2847 length:450 start_codon:yes stop_codon:yes gene_type:complete